jgi:hypothetical protein
MSNVIFDGDAELGDDGVLQGWCWNAQKPIERPIVEILVDERVASTNVASRFREDLRTRKIGDGYYGFMATLTKSLADAGGRFVITARERTSGRCFWRHIRGDQALPSDFASRIDALRHRLAAIAGSHHFGDLGKTSLAAGLAAEFGALGNQLRGAGFAERRPSQLAESRMRILRQARPVVIETPSDPRVAVIVIANSSAAGVLSAIAAIAPALDALNASLVLVDRGLNPEVALAPSLFGNLRYIFDRHRNLRSLLTGALKTSKAGFLIFICNPPETIAKALAEILPQMQDSSSVHMNSRSVEEAYRLLAKSPPDFHKHTSHLPMGLQFAAPRGVLERFVGLLGAQDSFTGHEDLDLAIRAVRDDVEICAWGEPDGIS